MEQLDVEFLLIRKLNKMLRPRLYRTLPQELIKAPSTALTPIQKDTLPVVENTPLTRAGRPLRKVAQKAHGVHAIEQSKSKLHGWVTEDQDTDTETLLTTRTRLPALLSHKVSSESPSTARSPTPDIDASLSSDDQEDLTWDSSPESMQLTFTNSNLTYNPATNLVGCQRLHATLIPQLTRSNAFRSPRTSQDTTPTLQVHVKSRIPRPSSALDVHTRQVNDLTDVLPLPERTISNSQDTPQRTRVFNRTSRNRRPINYRTYHLTGNTGHKEERDE